MTRICVAICERTREAFESAAIRASESADIIELRLDCLTRLKDVNAILDQDVNGILNRLSCPVILTFRPSEQGGHRALNHQTRHSFWKSAPETKWWDIESDLTPETDWSRIIISHHDFSGVPEDLAQIYERLAATPAAVVKIAVQANDVVDCIPVFQLLDRARSEGRDVIAIAMGNSGLATRILGPSRGAFLTYAALEEESATAPGQITAQRLRSVYHVEKIDRETMICGLLGRPVMHSVSPHMHNAAFRAAGMNGVYLPLEVHDLETFIERMVHPRTRQFDWNLRGLSVTAPHKVEVMRFLDWIDPTAQEIRAVNTIVIDGDQLRGFNTDAAGFLEPLLKVIDSLKGLRVAVIGSGGAARSVVWALLKHEASVTVFGRSLDKFSLLPDMFYVSSESLSSASFADYDLVINATPVGSGEFIDQVPASAEQLDGARVAYDLVYNPIETRFLQEAKKAGCKTVRGLEMLIAQAKNQFELWTGETPSMNVMSDAAAAALDH